MCDQNFSIDKMAIEFGVSSTAMAIRLKKLGYNLIEG
jgi:hypothetical protein